MAITYARLKQVACPYIWTPGNFYYQRYKRWGMVHTAAGMFGAQEHSYHWAPDIEHIMVPGTTEFIGAGTIVGEQYTEVPALTYYAEPLNAYGVRCDLFRSDLPIDLNYWTGWGVNQQYWMDWASHPVGYFPIIMNWKNEDLDGARVMVDTNGDWNGQWEGLQSAFQLPPNPFVCLAFRALEPAQMNARIPVIVVEFASDSGPQGGGAVRLLIGFDGTVRCMWRHPDRMVSEVGHDIEPPGWHVCPQRASYAIQDAKEEATGGNDLYKWLWIWVLPGLVAVSKDAFASCEYFTLPVPSPSLGDLSPLSWQDPFVKHNHLSISSNFGNVWGFQMGMFRMPINYPGMYGPVEFVPDNWANAAALDGAYWPLAVPAEYPVQAADGTTLGRCLAFIPGGDLVDQDGNPLPEHRADPDAPPPYGPLYEWKAVFGCYGHDCAIDTTRAGEMSDGTEFYLMNLKAVPAPFKMYQTPLLTAVKTERRAAPVQVSTSPPTTDPLLSTGDILIGFSLHERPGEPTAGGLVLDNQLAQCWPVLTDDRRRWCRLKTRWIGQSYTMHTNEYIGADTTVFTGWADEWSDSAEGGVQHVEAQLYDDLAPLREVQSSADLGVYSGTKCSEAVADILRSNAIPELNYARPESVWLGLEELDMVLNFGTAEKPLWAFEAGRSYFDFIRLIMLFQAHADLWIDRNTGYVTSGCRWCRRNRSGYPLYQSGGNEGEVDPHFWWYHTHNGPASSGCLLSDVERAGAVGVDFRLWGGGAHATNFPDEYHGEVFKIERIPTERIDKQTTTVVRRGSKQKLGAPEAEFAFKALDVPMITNDQFAGTSGYPGREVTDDVTLSFANTLTPALRELYCSYSHIRYKAPIIRVVTAFNPMYCVGKVFDLWGMEKHHRIANGARFRILDFEGTYQAKGPMQFATLHGIYLGGAL